MDLNDALKPVMIGRAEIHRIEQMPTETLPQMTKKMRILLDVADVEFAFLTADNLQSRVRALIQGQTATPETEKLVAEISVLHQHIVEKRNQLYRRR